MTKKKKTWIIIGAVGGTALLTVGLIIGVIFAVTYPWNIMYLGYAFSEVPPQPVITYAEFPFELVYEINGERIEIKDSLIVEWDGVDRDEVVENSMFGMRV